jgi:hypothetical protein
MALGAFENLTSMLEDEIERERAIWLAEASDASDLERIGLISAEEKGRRHAEALRKFTARVRPLRDCIARTQRSITEPSVPGKFFNSDDFPSYFTKGE